MRGERRLVGIQKQRFQLRQAVVSMGMVVNGYYFDCV